jgi:hypothetical protein
MKFLQMPVDPAGSTLHCILFRCNKLWEVNEKSPRFFGSPYIFGEVFDSISVEAGSSVELLKTLKGTDPEAVPF